MRRPRLTNVDLNLLVVLDAVLAEQNVTRASQRLGMTQPATSHALSRLRAMFDDPLLTRTTSGMKPTPLALEMVGSIRSILDQIEMVLSSSVTFDPLVSEREFTIGLSEHAALVILPKLASHLQEISSSIRLTIEQASHREAMDMIESGKVELAIGHFSVIPNHLKQVLLYEEEFLCAGRIAHPALAPELSLDAYLDLKHVRVSSQWAAEGYIDDLLIKSGMQRNINVTVNNYFIVPLVLQNTNAIATEPASFVKIFPKIFDLEIRKPPFDIPPIPVVQVWHERFSGDVGHAWLRKTILRLSGGNSANTYQ